MEQSLDINAIEKGGYLQISITGRIDTYRAGQLDQFLENVVHSGKYHLLLDLSQTAYISSTGIRIFVKYYKQLNALNGFFSICEASPMVDEVFKMVGMSNLFAKPAPSAAQDEAKNRWTVNLNEATFTFQIHEPGAFMNLQLLGNPELIGGPGFSQSDFAKIAFGSRRYGIGLGAIGSDFDDCSQRFGELLAVGDVVVTQSTDNNRVDFMTTAGQLIPEAGMLYGLIAEGGFGHAIRFECPDGCAVPLSDLVSTIAKELKSESYFVVILAECNGLVGASLIKPLASIGQGISPFSFPELKEQVFFTTEPDYAGTLVLSAGVISSAQNADIDPFLRPVNDRAELFSHLHAAVFPFHLLRKDDFNFKRIVKELFEMADPMQVLHHINDNRELTGLGESEFRQGLCWVGKINQTTKNS